MAETEQWNGSEIDARFAGIHGTCHRPKARTHPCARGGPGHGSTPPAWARVLRAPRGALPMQLPGWAETEAPWRHFTSFISFVSAGKGRT